MKCVYYILNKINQKIYIGGTTNHKKRKNVHISSLNNNRHHSKHIQRAWNKYGKDNFTFGILEILNDDKDLSNLIKKLDEREQYYINLFESYKRENGYNMCKVAQNRLGVNHSIATIQLLKKLKTDVSIKTRLKMSKSKLGKPGNRLGIKMSNDQILKKQKSVSQYSIDGTLIKKWKSITEIHKTLGFNVSRISLCCNKKAKSGYNFLWKFSDDDTEIIYKKYIVPKGAESHVFGKTGINNPRSKSITQYNKLGVFIKEWDNALQVNKILGYNQSNISQCCINKRKYAHGFIWKFTKSQ